MLTIHLNLQAEKVIEETKTNCEQKISEGREESRQFLAQAQEEHAAMVHIKK